VPPPPKSTTGIRYLQLSAPLGHEAHPYGAHDGAVISGIRPNGVKQTTACKGKHASVTPVRNRGFRRTWRSSHNIESWLDPERAPHTLLRVRKLVPGFCGVTVLQRGESNCGDCIVITAEHLWLMYQHLTR